MLMSGDAADWQNSSLIIVHLPLRSENTDVPGNVGIDAADRTHRAQRIFAPFHDRVAAHLERRAREGRSTRIVTIHSFTPVFLGVARLWHAGVLFDRASKLAGAILAALRDADPALNIAPNEPYIISRDSDYAVPVHGDDRGIEAVVDRDQERPLIADLAGVEEFGCTTCGRTSGPHNEPAFVVDFPDEAGKLFGDVLEGFESRRIDCLDLQRLHETLRLGVVIGVASAAHRTEARSCR
jgi:hypothetical protein